MLLIISVMVAWEAAWRLVSPPPVEAGPMLLVGVIGLVANVVSLAILAGGREANLNMKAAFLEVANDALGSLAVIVAAFVLACGGLVVGALAGLVSPAPTTAVAQVSTDTTTTVVRPGQSLWDIAEASGTADVPGMVARIAELNDLKGTTIRAGQTLEIPAA